MAYDQKEFERAQRTITNWRKVKGGAGLGYSIEGVLQHSQNGGRSLDSALIKPVKTAAVTRQEGNHIHTADGADWFLGAPE